MQMANPMSCHEAVTQYREEVSRYLASKGESPTLSASELETVQSSFDAGYRSDVCAALIRTDRFLTGAGLA